MNYNALIPEIYVSDYEESLRFYRDWLGFVVEYMRPNPKFAFLSSNGSQLMIQQQEPGDDRTGPLDQPYGRGINFQVEVPDIEAIAKLFKDHDYPTRSSIEEKWREIAADTLVGSLELKVLDPDGYYLRFSQELGTRSKDA